jgi:SAM-dependent methyltransferase
MAKVFGYLKGLHATHLIDLGVSLGLFSHLATHAQGLQSDSLAAGLNLHPPYVRLWCETACALELLDYDPTTGYRLAPHMDELLAQPNATFYVGGFPLVHLLLARDYARYPDLFRTGGTYPYQEHDQPFLEAVAEATQTLPRMFLETVLPKLPRLSAALESGASVLDVGCGGGHAMVAFAERFPAVRCAGVDIEPTSIALANDLIRARGLTSRVQATLLDGGELPSHYDGAYDLVTQFLVLHELRPEIKPAVIAQCARALKPGGMLLLFDERYPSGPAELRHPSQVFAVMAQWYEMTWGNEVNTREQIAALLEHVGLGQIDETTLSRFHIVVAEKPAS